jgi:polyhydroxyalkanoate synthase
VLAPRRERVGVAAARPVRRAVVGVKPSVASLMLDAHRRGLLAAGELVEKSTVGVEQLATLLTVEVGQTECEAVYHENKLTLEYYEPAEREHETPIFITYALVNRPYILDLQPDRSVIRRLMAAGYAVYLTKWGEPSRLDTSLELADYVERYMDNCIDIICAREDVDDLHLLGYCMGGTLSVMYASLYPERVRTLGLMATPIAFEGKGGILERWATHFDPDTAVDVLGNMPAELLALEFSLMDPIEHYLTKYVHLYENIEDDAFVANFARMERWIWDGVDVAGEAFREFVTDVYKQNELINNEFHLDGQHVDLDRVDVPVLQIVGEHDHIVPPASSLALNDAIGSDDVEVIEFPVGHIGISVSSKSQADLWPQVADWFATYDAGAGAGEDAVEGDEDAAERVEVVEQRAAQAVADARETDARETDERAADAGAGEADRTTGQRDVATVDGIGPTFAERLHAAGIDTVDALTETAADELARIAETSPGRVQRWLENC